MKKLIGVILFLCAIINGIAQDKAMKEDVIELLKLKGSAKLRTEIIKKAEVIFTEKFPEIPSDFWNDFKAEVTEETFVMLLLPVYEKYYTHEEIKELVRFYKTPVGRKMNKILFELNKDVEIKGREWAVKIARQLLKKIKEKYPDKF